MDLNEAIRSLAQFILHLSFDDQLGSGVFKDSTVLISRGDHTIILAGDDADRYGEILSSIYQAISERERPLSKRAVSNLVADFFIEPEMLKHLPSTCDCGTEGLQTKQW